MKLSISHYALLFIILVLFAFSMTTWLLLYSSRYQSSYDVIQNDLASVVITLPNKEYINIRPEADFTVQDGKIENSFTTLEDVNFSERRSLSYVPKRIYTQNVQSNTLERKLEITQESNKAYDAQLNVESKTKDELSVQEYHIQFEYSGKGEMIQSNNGVIINDEDCQIEFKSDQNYDYFIDNENKFFRIMDKSSPYRFELSIYSGCSI